MLNDSLSVIVEDLHTIYESNYTFIYYKRYINNNGCNFTIKTINTKC
jgi:hypothetical protein